MAKSCLLDPQKECDDCGDCNRCELDPAKICDNCFRCLETGDKEYAEILISDILTDKQSVDAFETAQLPFAYSHIHFKTLKNMRGIRRCI